jgi:hypothetical protein
MAQVDWSLAEDMTDPEKRAALPTTTPFVKISLRYKVTAWFYLRFEFGGFQLMTLRKPNVNQ